MPELLPGLSKLRLPRMIRVRQRFDSPVISNVSQCVQSAAAAIQLAPGTRVALTVGSRGIAQLATVVRATVAVLQAKGAAVFIVPAMGSHGGATAEGQREVLATLGVTETSAGAPIRSSMDAVKIGEARGVDVFMDATSLREADAIIPIARIKPHTGFRGNYESGVCKMLTIGLGKHVGCARLHREGYERFAELIPAAAKVALDTGKVSHAMALIENAREELAHVELIPGDRILSREPELLAMAKFLMPRLLVPEIDVLVVEEIGKDISGTGMDPNITGRGVNAAGFSGPKIARIVLLGLSDKTHGNAVGMGQADIITQRLYDAIDRTVTYTNALTSGSLANGKIPLVMPDDEQAIVAAACCVPGVRPEDARIVRIKNTLHLEDIEVSENLLETMRTLPNIELHA